MDHAAIYIRLSREDRDKRGDESESVQNQRMILDDYARQHGWRVYDHYVDEDWSGSNRSRPEFHRMIRDAEEGKFNIVLVKTQSRFARDSKYVEDYIHNLFRDKGIRFVSVVDNIDTYQTGSKLNSRVHAIFDEEQLDLLSANIRRSFREKAKQGQFFGSMPPYGYKKDPNNKNHLVIDPEAAAVVRLIFEMTADGCTYMAIAKYLNERGYLIPSEYKKRQGYKVDGMYDRRMKIGKWTRDTVRSFLKNEVYRGTVVNHKSTVVNFRTKKKRNLPKESHVKCEHMHEAIISDDLWNAVQELLKTRRRASGETGVKHPLSGKVFCEKCGSKMYKCKSGGIPYFRCYAASAAGECDNHKRIRLDELEALVIERINDVLERYVSEEYLAENVNISDSPRERIDECKSRRRAIEAELENSRAALKKLLESYMNGKIEESVYAEVQDDYIRKRGECERRLSAADEEIRELNRYVTTRGDKKSILRKYRKIDALTIPIVEQFIESIVIGEADMSAGSRNITINMAI